MTLSATGAQPVAGSWVVVLDERWYRDVVQNDPVALRVRDKQNARDYPVFARRPLKGECPAAWPPGSDLFLLVDFEGGQYRRQPVELDPLARPLGGAVRRRV